jgi:hypothetical protein
MNTGYWWESQKGKRPLGSPRHRWVDDIKIDFRDRMRVVWTGLIWLMIGIGGGLL